MARFCSLFSSSSGNCTYIGTGSSGILVDAGVSAKRITKALEDREISPQSINGIFVTHSHNDHVSGVRVLASKYNIPVFATGGTIREMEATQIINGKFPVEIVAENGNTAGDMLINSFPVPHDTVQPCGFCITFPDGRRAAVATDTGHITQTMLSVFKNCDLVMMESNHDVGMLQNGDYPYYLKRRILSSNGHLSNEDCASAAVKIIANGTTRLFLGHLSRENNIPSLAYETTHSALTMAGAVLGRDYILGVNKIENDEGMTVF